MKIIAIIVTYNRPEKLEKSIRSIYAGRLVPHEVVVINNNSTDSTGEVLKRLQMEFQTLTALETRKNLGGAGGFFVGLKVAYDRGASHLWIMDDDTYCQTESLNQLVSTYLEVMNSEKVGFLCSRVNWTNGEICEMNQPEASWDWMRRFHETLPIIKVNSCSFVSCFFSREMLEEVGLPIKEFFIWFDDHEFTYRISKRYPCYAVMNSIVLHDIPQNQGAYYAAVDDDNLWKFAHGASNESWFRFWRKSPIHWLLFFAQRNRDMHKGGVSLKNRLRVNLRMLLGIFRKHQVRMVGDCHIEELLL